MDAKTKKAIKALPPCGYVMYDPLAPEHQTIDGIAHTILCEIDLILEAQDGTDPRDLAPLKRWLKKYSPKTLEQL